MRRRLNGGIRKSLRELRLQLSLLNHNVGAYVELRDIDLDCLDLIQRDGPLNPSLLARRTGLHPATVTGILDRLERAGWVSRDRDPVDRRAVIVGAQRGRSAELLRLYAGMNSSVNRICQRYSEADLELLLDFLHRAADAGRAATDDLVSSWEQVPSAPPR